MLLRRLTYHRRIISDILRSDNHSVIICYFLILSLVTPSVLRSNPKLAVADGIYLFQDCKQELVDDTQVSSWIKTLINIVLLTRISM